MCRVATLFLMVFICISGCKAKNNNLSFMNKSATYSYIIGNINNDNIDEQKDANLFATPASCLKIITALVAYKDLGKEYFYKTNLYFSKSKNIFILSFEGDPNLAFDQLLNLLQTAKINDFKAKIILDASKFQTPAYSPNNIIGDIGTSYCSPVSNIIIDHNLVDIVVIAGKMDKKAKVSNNLNYKIDSQIITNNQPTNIKFNWKNDLIIATGNINQQEKLLEYKISPKEIDSYILRKMAKLKEKLGIKTQIKIYHNKESIPQDLVLLGSINSLPLKDIIPPALKKSDNLVFDVLYLTIANKYTNNNFYDWSEGDKIFKKLIKEYFEVDIGQAIIVDGSGLSRYNRIQPKKLFEILKQGYLTSNLVEALPKNGEVKSTLEHRNLVGFIKAKTGSMLGINCLCGYKIHATQPKAFVVMVNNFTPPARDMNDIIDRLVNFKLRN